MNLLHCCLVLALASSAAGAADPLYTPAGLVNASNGAPGPFAPNSIVSLYGSGLSFSQGSITQEQVNSGLLPTELAGVRVMIGGIEGSVPLFLVSENQINFLVPPNLTPGEVNVWVARQGVNGPQVRIAITEAAPALFPNADAPGYAIAQDWPAYRVAVPDHAIARGGIAILYATGLGRTDHYPTRVTEIPVYPGALERIGEFRVYLNGRPLDGWRVLYAGLAPGWAGLYQINILVPEDAGPDPEIRIAVGDSVSPAGLKLAAR